MQKRKELPLQKSECSIMLRQVDGRTRGGQIVDDAYEAVGLRDTGDIFTVEILGRQREAVAVHTAQMWADQWQVTVGLYRVPFVNFGSAPWRPNQMRLVRQFVPTRIES